MKKYVVLLVDDEPNIVNALRRSLSDEGYGIYVAYNGQEALEVLKQRQVDLVVSDQIMPGMTGVELLTFVRLRYPDTARIMLTGNANLSMAAEAINYGEVDRMLVKPWDDTELKLSIQLSLEQMERRKQQRLFMMKMQDKGEERGILERNYPGILEVEKDLDGKILLK
jgi:DNA-binding NtrC family response regulator